VKRAEPVDVALRLYAEGVPLDEITVRAAVSYSALMKAKKERHIPDRPQRADGTMRSGAKREPS
jgi:hypothetical protein